LDHRPNSGTGHSSFCYAPSRLFANTKLPLRVSADADAKNEKQLGTDNGFCLRTVAGEAYECNWTAFLADGQITAEGPFYDAKDSILTVTGGTGAYDGMHGQLKLHARDAKSSEYDFVYEISK